ncbi:MAG: type III secretion system cytoplasmic ring protein SctQ [Candidatus Competibacter sp.]
MLNLPTITRAELQLRNRLARKGGQSLRLPLADNRDWRWSPRAAPPADLPVCHLPLEIDGQPGWVEISARLLRVLTGAQVADLNDLMELPQELRGLLVEAALETLLALAEQRSSKPLKLGDLDFRPTPTDGGIGISCQLAAGDDCIDGQLRFSNHWLPLVTQLVDALPDAPGRCWDALPVPVRFELGQSRLGLAEFRELARDDLILIEQGAGLHERTVSVRIGADWRFRGALEPQRVILQQRETTMTDTLNEPQALARLDELPVTVSFDLGESALALGELKALEPGYAFELARGLERPVTVRANGAIIGAGELIQVGDCLGVRVVDLFAGAHG